MMEFTWFHFSEYACAIDIHDNKICNEQEAEQAWPLEIASAYGLQEQVKHTDRDRLTTDQQLNVNWVKAVEWRNVW
jgi:hypothetical protein